ncbi:MAG: hypothetical protein ACO1OB_17170 [Archangium sp.]
MVSSFLVVQLALSQAGVVNGEVVVVADTNGAAHTTTNIVAGLGSTLCAFGARGVAYAKPDVFDVVVTFTNHPLTGSPLTSNATPKATIVRASGTGYTWGSPLIVLQPSEFGSAAKLSHCVFMGPVQNLPADPDADFLQPAFPTGTMPSGTTGIEVLGHEFGHHWLVQSAYDQGQGLRAMHRSDTREGGSTLEERVSIAQLHWSHLADTQSVMYGNFITPLGNGQFKLEGGARKFGPMDQYFMGLRSPEETPPMLVINDGSQMGLIGTPLRRGESATVSGTAVNVSVADFVRAQGVRTPAFPNAQRCFRLAFVLVTQQGTTATAAELALVDAYRRRFEGWFRFATDNRANAVTSLDVFEPCPEPPLGSDGGVEVDAGLPEVDAGAIEVDAGLISDAGMEPPVQMPMPDGGSVEPGTDTMKFRPGCECDSMPAGGLLLTVLLASRRRKVRRHGREELPNQEG